MSSSLTLTISLSFSTSTSSTSCSREGHAPLWMHCTQALVDLVLYIVFFLPGIVALTWAGWIYAGESLAIREQTFSAEPLPLYPFKFIIPLAGFTLLLQGVVEIIRCVQCIQTGAWPSREQDVEEVDVEKLKEMVNVKDEDIAALDRVVAAKENAR